MHISWVIIKQHLWGSLKSVRPLMSQRGKTKRQCSGGKYTHTHRASLALLLYYFDRVVCYGPDYKLLLLLLLWPHFLFTLKFETLNLENTVVKVSCDIWEQMSTKCQTSFVCCWYFENLRLRCEISQLANYLVPQLLFYYHTGFQYNSFKKFQPNL